MNSGGELQLSAIGVQNDYIIGNPQVSFYKVVYNRHTNFSIANIKLNNSERDGTIVKGSEILIDVPRNGDLLSKCYLEMNVSNNYQVGPDIDGENNDSQGVSVSLSSDGNRVAVGARDHDSYKGTVRIYDYDSSGSQWNQVGSDIDGETNDLQGASVSLSSDGNRVAVGASDHDSNGTVRIYDYDSSGNQWNQVGSDIDGVVSGEKQGKSVSLSSNGNRVAVGAYFHNNIGTVRIYNYNSSTFNWDKVGPNIDGEDIFELQGASVSLSSDGNRVAVGAPYHSSQKGTVRIYDYDSLGNQWNQVGSDINGLESGERQGNSVSLSSNGDRVAVGAPYHGSQNGTVRIYDYDSSGSEWNQVGSDIDGETNDFQGASVSLSSDGNRVAVGATKHGSDNGTVRIYEYNSSTFNWDKVAPDIDGETNDSQGASVFLSSDGNRVAVGADDHDSGKGTLRIYDLSFNNLKYIHNIQCLIHNNIIDSHSYRYIHAYMSSLVDTDTLENYYAQQYVYNNSTQSFQIPLLFWFCNNYGNALPLIALQYSPVQFSIKLSDTYEINSLDMYCNYIFLDTKERRQITLTKHEYLIEQVQENILDLNNSNGLNEVQSDIELDLYFPTKYLLWYLGKNKISDTSENNNIYLTNATLKINNQDRFEEQDYNYFKHLQFLNSGFINKINNHYYKSLNYIENRSNVQTTESINLNYGTPLYYIYSFSINPYLNVPSGTINFSKIDKVNLIIKHKSLSNTNTTSSKIHLFAINYNIFRIESGIGGLVFSN